MATFKVGQKVKVVAMSCRYFVHLVGHEAVISAVGPCNFPTGYAAHVDGIESIGAYGYGFEAEELAPLTDPKADAFLESIRKLGREPNITPPEEMERIKREDRVPR